MFFGCCTAFGGFGLDCGACFGCYGCDRVDCCNVCIGGMAINFTSPCIYGIVAGCCVGCKMMGILKWSIFIFYKILTSLKKGRLHLNFCFLYYNKYKH